MQIVELSATVNTTPAESCALAAGNFDGVHKGHQAVLKATKTLADRHGVKAAVLTFEPHPRQLLSPASPPFRLTDADEKARLMADAGIDILYRARFDESFAAIEARDFSTRILALATGARAIVTGQDFAYGKGRAGNMATLSSELAPLGVDYHAIASVAGPDGAVYSSSRVREALKAGDIAAAAGLLGRLWSICGIIIDGDKRGRTIGFPTANFVMKDWQRPRYGVYAVWARIGEEKIWRPGVANIGNRPTIGGLKELAEVHLFSFEGDIYGQSLTVRPARFLRPEQRFDGLKALTDQIGKDVLAAQAVLQSADPDQRF